MAIRVYELSKKLGLTNKELIDLLKEHGYSLASIALVPPEAQALAEKLMAKGSPKVQKPLSKEPASQKEQPKIESPKMESVEQPKEQAKKAIVKKVEASQAPAQKVSLEKKAPQKPSQPTVQAKPTVQKAAAPVIQKKVIEQPETKKSGLEPGTAYDAPMTVGDFAAAAGVPVSEIIIALLKKGIAAPVTQLLPETTIRDLATLHGLTLVKKETARQSKEMPLVSQEAAGEWKERLPIVVVIGHVDHGKTTLLDFIRKTRVASREKGGITQHVGAYDVKTKQGGVIFLDTPGHEAFSLIRVRGIKVADIAILIVAADDGIMPQTEEAINAAKAAGIPMVVAINKIDKASPAQVEAVKSQLARHNLVPEEWGGQTIVMPISAKTGQGVDELLDVLVLQSQVMDLKANVTVPARGYILESKFEKGRGPVATVICQHGVLKVGDYFIAGEATGRVSSLVTSDGKRVQKVGPSVPVQVAGFSELPHSGDLFEVHTSKVIKKGIPAAQQRADLLLRKAGASREADIDIILKTDNVSSREAVAASLSRLTSKHGAISIIQSGVGDITESDVMLAADTGAYIYGFGVKVQPNAMDLVHKKGVVIKTFDIIYKLIEEVEALLESGKPVEMVTKKIGEATVLKVFDIKNLGVIAGSIVREGRFTRNGKVKVYRGKEKIGEGPIKSLQREKKAVKEVHSGFECGFMIEGFSDFEPDDRVECYEEVPVTK